MYELSTDTIRQQAGTALSELLAQTRTRPGDIVVIGCSSSEILGAKIGSVGSLEAAEAVYDGVLPVLREKGLYLAAQCCEHLNRALVVERAAAELYRLDEVNAVPQMHAGGSFGTVTYGRMEDPVLVEEVRAVAGMDIGGTLIGMHMKPVAVPVRVSIDHIGEAILILARSRAKFVGGERAHYNEALK
jgi:uncharacterized protein (TIGR01440 family)